VSAVERATSSKERFAELYEEFLPKVYRYVRYRVGDVPVTEDLTSTVFEKALVNFHRYSSDRASFSTWIFSIARNVIIDHFRARGRHQSLSLEKAEVDVPANEPGPDERLEKKEEHRRLRASLSRLSPQEQELISLKFGSGLNNRQIARTMGLSESNVGTRLYRAVRKLRDSFQEAPNG
jgi:RNA polymerase sigma-70 factor (ECF subfamily)